MTTCHKIPVKHNDDVIKWKHFPCYWPFVWGIHRSPVNSPHKGQRRGALMFSLICARINGWVNNREAGDLRRLWAHYDVIVMRNRSISCIMCHAIYTRLCCALIGFVLFIYDRSCRIRGMFYPHSPGPSQCHNANDMIKQWEKHQYVSVYPMKFAHSFATLCLVVI